MEKQIIVLYEVVLPDTNERTFTYSREQALECYYDEYMVFEKHIAKYKPSIFTDTQTIVSLRWDNNPEFNPDFEEE
jgi:hypothetical protein